MIQSAVADLSRRIRPDLSDWGLTMSITMAYRYTASCIPAARELFAQRLSAIDVLQELDSSEQKIDNESTLDHLFANRFYRLIEPLVVEIFGHHASIPLIFAILYRDFRFALADIFLKRALAVFAP